MAVAWPLSLQQILNQANFRNAYGKTVIKQDMESGPPKKRQYQTKGNDLFTTSIELYNTDYTTFDTFFKTSLAGGSLDFDFDHPITGVASTFNMDEPNITPLGGLWYRVSMQWTEI